MKKAFTLLASTALLASAASISMANDIGPDQAVKLLESGKIKSFEEMNKTALSKHPDGTIRDTELENEYGKYVYQIELRDEAGKEWDVEIDAESGKVLRDHQDD